MIFVRALYWALWRWWKRVSIPGWKREHYPYSMSERDQLFGRTLEEWNKIDHLLLYWGIKDAAALQEFIESSPRKPGDWSGY